MTGRSITIACALALCMSGGSAAAADAIPDYVTAAVKDPGRGWFELPLDGSLHPAETMAFAGVKPGQVVVDLMPEGGYYTRILSKIVGPKGRVYDYVVRSTIAPRDARAGAAVKHAGQNLLLNRVQLAQIIEGIPEYNNVHVFWEPLTAFGGEFALPEQADVVFTAHDYHSLHGAEFGIPDMVAVNKAIFRSMKPGGIYVVSDHAAAPGIGFAVVDTLHRSDPEAVKQEILAAGFEFDGESKVATNPNDNHKTVASNEKAKTMPDNFLFRFRKPLSAIGDKRPPHGSMDGYYGNTFQSNVGARGAVTGKRERRLFFQRDGRYVEFGAPNTGNNPMQSGLWFFSADGHTCLRHMTPFESKGYIDCNNFRFNVKPGDSWVAKVDADEDRDAFKNAIAPGYQYFDAEVAAAQ